MRSSPDSVSPATVQVGADVANPQPSLLPAIAVTIGDPAGIGPEISLKAAFSPEVLSVCRPVLIGDPEYLQEWTVRFGLPGSLRVVSRPAEIAVSPTGPLLLASYNAGVTSVRTGETSLRACKDDSGSDGQQLVHCIAMGREQQLAGALAAASIEAAVALCLAGEVAAMATAPINKKSLAMAGVPFPGHTEFLAHLTSCEDYAMAFIAPRLRVALLTTHVPLHDVPGLVQRTALGRLIRLVDRELKSYGIERPRIALAGINPHAGEGGLFGDEEDREMVPAIDQCRSESIDVSGPYPGDTIFLRAARGEFDLVISCYHDQGLIPIKCLAFGEAVNVTFGLPIIRTSVDHGTAFDIAGRGLADEASMIAAIRLAAQLAGLKR